MDILDDMGVSKLSAKVFLKVNYSFKQILSSCIRKPFQSWLLIGQHSVSAVLKHAVYMARPNFILHTVFSSRMI